MEEYIYCLYFEARYMTDKEMEKLRRYFLKRRESGGGECILIRNNADNNYQICFKDKEDQERVLQRKFHTVSLPNGELQLTVSRINPAETPDQPRTSLPQTFRKLNTKHLEKTFHFDIFLLYYLRDNSKAFSALEKQLSSIGCEMALNCDEEEAVVTGDVDKCPGGAFGGVAEKWEQQVDRIILDLTENYVCHHVVEARLTCVLLQDLSFTNEDIRVYTDTGHAVLVGKAEAVNKRLQLLKENVPIRMEKVIPEEQLRLVEAEFSREMSTNYPAVKISRGKGVMVMDGLEVEVQAGATKLDQLIGNIKHREIQFPTALMNFITLSDAASKYQARFWQSLRNPVSIERRSSLLLSSLSANALDTVQDLLEKELKVSTTLLQETMAVSSNVNRLKNILIEAQDEANRDDYSVEVSFVPGIYPTKTSKVRLVGYTANVLELEEMIQDYQMNQVTIQDVVNLSKPEFADCFDKILDLTGIELTDVTSKVSPFPNNCVILSGPRCKVEEAKLALNSALASLTSSTLVLEGTGAQRYFRAGGKVSKELVESSFQVIIREQQCVPSPDVNSKQRSSSCAITSLPRHPIFRSQSCSVGATGTTRNVTSPINKATVAIKLGSLENEQVNVLVVPMVNKKLNSTRIGVALQKKGGSALQSSFDSMASISTPAPGEVLQVNGPPSLGCSKIFFIESLPWDGVRGTSVQALEKGLWQCLDLCTQQGLSSLAVPIIGPGKLLKYPLSDAIGVLIYSLSCFGSSVSSSSLSTIHIVIQPGNPDSEELYRDLYQQLNMKQGEAIFRLFTSDLDEMTIALGGGVKLRIVFGDITNETTEVVVNTTDFTNFGLDGVCKDILNVAGPEVQAELKAATINQGSVVFTKPGRFPCRAILHVCGEKTPGHVEALTERIANLCDTKSFKSVAIPAICTGAGGMQPSIVAGAFLRGIRTATSAPLYNLRDVRIILNKINVFLAFQEEAMQMFPTTVKSTGDTSARSKSRSQKQQPRAAADLSVLSNSPPSQQSVFLILGPSRKSVDDATAKLKHLYQDQCSTYRIKQEELECLAQEDMKNLMEVVDGQGLSVQEDQPGAVSVHGQKDGVNQAMMVIHASLQGNLKREVRIRQEEDLYSRVVWCIMNHNGHWTRLPRPANYNLEKHDFERGIVDAEGATWTVDLNKMEATSLAATEPRKLKRLENLPDFIMPLYWDSMAPGETMKVVPVVPSSAEDQVLRSSFRKTSTKTVTKIERVQNIHLRRAYEGQKTHISHKNVQEGGGGEKHLYHGTAHDNCNSIMKTGFDRRFSGQNGTIYGTGVYFAVNADYSAQSRYSRPAADGSQVMFVARVLTGVYTQGNSSMKVPPARDGRRPDERFDSVVDRMDRPSMFVVFHDNQSYPDYLITFK